MRTLIFLAACLSLIACVWGNNLIMGKRVPGDHIIEHRIIHKPRIFGRPQVGICGATAPPGSVISFISVTTPNPWVVGIKPIRGGIMSHFVMISGISRPSTGIMMTCTIFATPMKKPTTTQKPTTTTQKTTTTSTTPTTTTTEQTSTTESTTTEQTSTTESTTTEQTSTTESTTTEQTSTTESTTTEPTWTTTSEPSSTTTETSETTTEEPTTTESD